MELIRRRMPWEGLDVSPSSVRGSSFEVSERTLLGRTLGSDFSLATTNNSQRVDDRSGADQSFSTTFGSEHRQLVTSGELMLVQFGYDRLSLLVRSEHRVSLIIDSLQTTAELIQMPVTNGSYDVTMRVGNADETIARNIPADIPFQSVAIAVGVKVVSATYIARKERNSKDGDDVQSVNCVVPQGFTGFPADNRCSFGYDSGNWSFTFPCAGTFTVNVDECCKRHDKALFCVKTDWERTKVDDDFANCVAADLFDTGSRRMSWWCAWLFAPLLFVLAFVIVKLLIDIIFILILGPNYKKQYLNYSGNYDKSCLCGGDRPTIFCGSNPEDPKNYLCRGKTTSCCVRANGTVIKSNPDLPCAYNAGPLKNCSCGKCCWRPLPNGEVVVQYPSGGDARDCCVGTPGPSWQYGTRCSR